MSISAWFNASLFSPFNIAILVVACSLWGAVYVIVIRNIIKEKFVEIPIIGVLGNFAWEFVWSFPYGEHVAQGLGGFFMWGYRAWFFLDVFIVYSLFRYGALQVQTEVIRRHLRPIMAGLLIMFGVLFYTYAYSGYDNLVGTMTAYLDNILMSAFYVHLLLTRKNTQGFSEFVAWGKMLGTGLVSLAVCLQFNTNLFLIAICVATFVLDVLYIVVFYSKKNSVLRGAEAP